MRRIIEILKMFQINLEFVSISYLIEKFSLTVRTLQKDIQKINRLLAPINNCKIVKNQEKLIIIGDNPKVAIDVLLKKFLIKLKCNDVVNSYQLIFYHIWENQPLTNTKLLNFTNSTFYNLKKEINLINNYFNYYDLVLKLKFKMKQGWFLEGSEFDLRRIAMKILINQLNSPLHPNNYLDTSLLNLQNKLSKLLINNNFSDYFLKDIIWFLIIVIKRIKFNQFLDSYCCPLLFKVLINDKIIENNFNKLTNILEKQFNVKFNYYEKDYLTSLMLLNQKKLNYDMISNLISSINNFINQLIFKEYQLLFAIKKIQTRINEFLNENFLKLIFNFYQDFNFNFINDNYFWSNTYWYGWEIANIIVFVLRKFNINVKFRLFISDQLLMIFNSFYLDSKEINWKVPLYYQKNNSFSHQIKKLILFIKSSYKNIILESLDISNSHYKINFLNKNYAILFDSEDNNILPTKRFFLINSDQFLLNQQLKQNLDIVVKKMLIDKIRSSILVFKFFSKQRFSSIKSFLFYLQEALIRKFKLNSLNFQLRDSFINSTYSTNKMLVIHKLVSKNNVTLPIILIYLKSPLFFHKKFPINFIFILINNSDTLYQYQGLLSYLDFVKTNFNLQISSVKNLYQIINNFLL
ncbi:MAG: helix-turn-helix domain-containing protein [Spiroplasma sp.]|nr:helix-turn-helix domain-containing protein [Spiroplasma sp.]